MSNVNNKISQATLVARIRAAKSRPRKKRRTRPKDDPLEHDIQSKAVSVIRRMVRPDVHVYAIANGGYRRPSEAVRLKAEGVKPGIADLIFIAPNRVVGFLEMKTKSGRLSDEQIGFQAICIRHGHLWGEARSVDEAVAVVRAWGLLRGQT